MNQIQCFHCTAEPFLLPGYQSVAKVLATVRIRSVSGNEVAEAIEQND